MVVGCDNCYLSAASHYVTIWGNGYILIDGGHAFGPSVKIQQSIDYPERPLGAFFCVIFCQGEGVLKWQI